MRDNPWNTTHVRPPARGTYLCRLAGSQPCDVQYVGLLWDDGWYGQGYRRITHWMVLPELPERPAFVEYDPRDGVPGVLP